ncbi:MAG TPA: high frequency lysogenization protein HflD [Methylocystis sp.]|nr:high frequency lysogenization protein HflD [Methylocystis sp.]
MRVSRRAVLGGALALTLGAVTGSLARAAPFGTTGASGRKNPFAIGGGEGAGAAGNGFAGTILAWQNRFHLELQNAARRVKSESAAYWSLLAASFAYGVFHAAGPGHGKAVLASYMIASRSAVRRGMILAGLAALLQGLVAIAIVGLAAALLGFTALEMKSAVDMVELASYAAIAILGAVLVWKKGAALLTAWRAPSPAPASAKGFRCEAVDASSGAHPQDCEHCGFVGPENLSDQKFSFGSAAGAVIAAGLRPCSGAILILVFTLAQGIFKAGGAAVLAMSGGTALTTGALAAATVLARRLAQNWAGAERRRTVLALRGAELLAAALVLLLGLALLLGASVAQAA